MPPQAMRAAEGQKSAAPRFFPRQAFLGEAGQRAEEVPQRFFRRAVLNLLQQPVRTKAGSLFWIIAKAWSTLQARVVTGERASRGFSFVVVSVASRRLSAFVMTKRMRSNMRLTLIASHSIDNPAAA